MLEQIFYAVVALIYFYKVATGCKKNELLLDNRASANVACLFVIVQPLSLLLGGYTGMLAFSIFAVFSYNFLPKNLDVARGEEMPAQQHKPPAKKKVH